MGKPESQVRDNRRKLEFNPDGSSTDPAMLDFIADAVAAGFLEKKVVNGEVRFCPTAKCVERFGNGAKA